jgi:hypothetical protein
MTRQTHGKEPDKEEQTEESESSVGTESAAEETLQGREAGSTREHPPSTPENTRHMIYTGTEQRVIVRRDHKNIVVRPGDEIDFLINHPEFKEV